VGIEFKFRIDLNTEIVDGCDGCKFVVRDEEVCVAGVEAEFDDIAFGVGYANLP
jgi:hypothetical protein